MSFFSAAEGFGVLWTWLSTEVLEASEEVGYSVVLTESATHK